MYWSFYVWITWYFPNYFLGECVQNADKNAILCRCQQGWKGTKCDEIECITGVSCNNHGLISYKHLGNCTVVGNRRVCQCAEGWTGDSCNKQICPMENKCGTNGSFYI